MNEQIKELLERADMGYLFNKGEMLPGMVNPDSLKKFAELIVKECADVAGNLRSRDLPDVSDILLEHFGVEE